MKDRPRRLIAVAGAGLGAAIGLASEQSATRFGNPATWVPDLAVGWTFIAGGLVLWDRRPSSRSGPLMAATGAAWFLPNFSFSSLAALAWVADRSLFLYRGPLVHLLLTFPTGSADSRLTFVAVATGYVLALTTVWQSDPATIVLTLLLVVVGLVEYRRAVGPARRARRVALGAEAFAGLVLAGSAAARLIVPNERAIDPSHLVFEVSLCVLAVSLVVLLMRAPWERAAVTDLVVEMGEARSDGLRDELARALGDPTLEVGYRVPGIGGLVDARGRPFALPDPESGRAVTTVRSGAQEIAVLVHDRSVLDDPGLVEAVSAAARLAASNARLQADVRAGVVELAASRRRLLDAGDEERRRLAHRLQDGAERDLDEMAATVERARTTSSGPATVEQLGAVESQLRQTREDLERLGRGLHPRDLTDLGLVSALRSLADRATFPVTVGVRVTDMDPTVEAAAYYLVAEALTNVTKHAAATFATVSVASSDGHLTVEVTDDGVGGAVGARGSGLRGLVDRIETLGGSLSITSPGGEGTRLAARIPLHPVEGT
ncbi:MAG TPA: ATP-binding protein [Actinomycetota bacterium]